MPRKLTSAICWVLVGMLLFMQAAFAARPCLDAGMSAASALAATNDRGSCETSVSDTNLCVIKCIDGDKLPASRVPLLDALPISFTILPVALWDNAPLVGQRDLNTSAHDPPKTVRFCSLLI